jgi:Mycothiol maleylpyruvate isomerase N-terminal domain
MPEDLQRAAAAVIEVLGRRATAAEWSSAAGDLEWSCWETAAHVAHDLAAYALQVAASPGEKYLPVDLVVRADVPPSGLLIVIESTARLLSKTVAATPAGARAWHWGPTDPGGFIALGCNELLVHGYDIARGLGVDWKPPAPLASAVVDRLFPDAPEGDAGDVLLWCTGRRPLGARPRRTSWVPRAAL